MSSSIKTIVLLAALAVTLAGALRIGGLKMWTGIWIAGALVIAGNLIPETQSTA
jgi:hypothetical protein